MRKKNLLIVFTLLFSLFSYTMSAQTKIKNNAFIAGEKLTYDLYYKYGILQWQRCL